MTDFTDIFNSIVYIWCTYESLTTITFIYTRPFSDRRQEQE